MKRIRIFLSQNKHFYLLLLFIPLQIWFDHSELTLSPQYFTQTALDEKIPFLREFVVPYLLWFLYIPYGIIFLGNHSKKDFHKLILFLVGGMAAANLMFTIFPNAQGLRPEIRSNDPFSLLVKMIYFLDTPTDVCPSMHVINSIAVNAALQHSEAFSEKRFGKACSSVMNLLICLSTVFIKQHAVLDVVCGAATAALFYIPLYLVPSLRARSAKDKEPGQIACEGQAGFPHFMKPDAGGAPGSEGKGTGGSL